MDTQLICFLSHLSEPWHIPDDFAVRRPNPLYLGHGRPPRLADHLCPGRVGEVNLHGGLLNEDGAGRLSLARH